jgi:hypothetical protein
MRPRQRTSAQHSPARAAKPIGRTQARLRPGCQAEGPRKDPGPADHGTAEQPMWSGTVASDVRFGVTACLPPSLEDSGSAGCATRALLDSLSWMTCAMTRAMASCARSPPSAATRRRFGASCATTENAAWTASIASRRSRSPPTWVSASARRSDAVRRRDRHRLPDRRRHPGRRQPVPRRRRQEEAQGRP